MTGIKAMINFGDDINDEYEFLCVYTSRMDDFASKADVILPAMSLIEKSGTFTACDGKLLTLTPAIEPKQKLPI